MTTWEGERGMGVEMLITGATSSTTAAGFTTLPGEDPEQKEEEDGVLMQGWIYVPQRGEFILAYGKLTKEGLTVYSDDGCDLELGVIRASHMSGINSAVLDSADRRTLFQGKTILVLWKSDKTVYYFLTSNEREVSTKWKKKVRKVIESYRAMKSSSSSSASSSSTSTESETAAETSPSATTLPVLSTKRPKVEFPLPGIVVHTYTTLFFKTCVRYLYVEREREDLKFKLIEHKYSNFIWSPIGTFALLSLLWAGARDDSATLTQLSQFLVRMPDYDSTVMGYWECDRQARTKQLLMYLRVLTGEFTDAYYEAYDQAARPYGGEKEEVKDEDLAGDHPSPMKADDDDSVSDVDDPSITTLLVSNNLFIDTVFELSTTFTKKFKRYVKHARLFDESVHREVKMGIDEWVDRRSCGKSSGVSKILKLTEASAIGVSTLFFHGLFRYSWTVMKNKDGQSWFSDPSRMVELKKVSLMKSENRRVLYHQTDDGKWTVIAMDFALSSSKSVLNRLSLVLVKRNMIEDREHVAKKPLSVSEVYRLLHKAKKRRVTVTMPKLDIECTTDLSGVLQSLLDIPFDVSKADFSKLCPTARSRGLYLSQMVHSVRIVIDEAGQLEMPPSTRSSSSSVTATAAASAASVSASGVSASSSAVLEECYDYPFDVLLMDPDSDLVFFCGRIADPNPSSKFDTVLLSTEIGLRKDIRDSEDKKLEESSRSQCLMM